MRTTLVLDDDLVQKAKHVAVDERLTLSELVNRALRQLLRPPQARDEISFAMITFGPSDKMADHRPADFAEQEERDDRSSLGKA